MCDLNRTTDVPGGDDVGIETGTIARSAALAEFAMLIAVLPGS